MIPTVKLLLDMDWHTCNVCNIQAYTRIQTATIQRLQTYLNYKNIRIHMLSAPFLPLFKNCFYYYITHYQLPSFIGRFFIPTTQTQKHPHDQSAKILL